MVIQSMWFTAPSSPTMVGSAVDTMVWSSDPTNIEIMSAVNTAAMDLRESECLSKDSAGFSIRRSSSFLSCFFLICLHSSLTLHLYHREFFDTIASEQVLQAPWKL